MNGTRFGRLVRAIRVRQRLTQRDLGRRAGVPRQAVSEIERGEVERHRIRTISAICRALDAGVDLRLLWHGPELDRLLDARHAAVGAFVKRRLEGWGWAVRVEVSFNVYGDRGRFDLLAFHQVSRTLLVVEVKTALVDVQDLLGSLDVKRRVAPGIARQSGWQPRSAVTCVVFDENRATRRRIEVLNPLFASFSLRGRAATAWLRAPRQPAGDLLWITAGGRRAGLTARVRVRRTLEELGRR